MLLLLLSLQSCPTMCDPIGRGPPGSSVPGILQARTLEWVAMSSNEWKWKVKVKSLSHVRLVATPWTAAYRAPLSMGVSRQEYWSGLPLPSLRESLNAFVFIFFNVITTDAISKDHYGNSKIRWTLGKREIWEIQCARKTRWQKTCNNSLAKSGRCKLRLLEKDGKQGAGKLHVLGKLNF